MLVTLDEAKEYLRVDFDDDNSLIESLPRSAQELCMDVVRIEEEADHHALTLTLRSLLFGMRKEAF